MTASWGWHAGAKLFARWKQTPAIGRPTPLSCAEGSAFYVAIFNYRLTSETKTVDLARVGASPRQNCHITELWSGTALTVQGTLSTILEGALPSPALIPPAHRSQEATHDLLGLQTYSPFNPRPSPGARIAARHRMRW